MRQSVDAKRIIFISAFLICVVVVLTTVWGCGKPTQGRTPDRSGATNQAAVFENGLNRVPSHEFSDFSSAKRASVVGRKSSDNIEFRACNSSSCSHPVLGVFLALNFVLIMVMIVLFITRGGYWVSSGAVANRRSSAADNSQSASVRDLENLLNQLYTKLCSKIESAMAAGPGSSGPAQQLNVTLGGVEQWLSRFDMNAIGDMWLARIRDIVAESVSKGRDMTRLEREGYALVGSPKNIDDFLSQLKSKCGDLEVYSGECEKLQNDRNVLEQEKALLAAQLKKVEQDEADARRNYQDIDGRFREVLAAKMQMEGELADRNRQIQRITSELDNLMACLDKDKKQVEDQCESRIEEIRNGYDSFVPLEILRLFDLSPATLSAPISKRKYSAMRSYLNVVDAAKETFVAKFQDFDCELDVLRQDPDFESLRKRIEEDVRKRFNEVEYTVAWSHVGRPFDPALHTSDSGVGTIITGVKRALIKRGADVIVKAFVVTA